MRIFKPETLRQARRLVRLVVGFTLLLVGIVMVALPGPAIIVIPTALAILATEYLWARALLNYVRRMAGLEAEEPDVAGDAPAPVYSHVTVIANPTAGRSARARLAKALAAMDGMGVPHGLLLTEAPGHATELARTAALSKAEMVIAAGGDGTVSEVMNGLMGTGVPLGVIPLGTANVLARELGLPLNPSRAARRALSSPAHPVCLGRITFGPEVRHFILMAGFGFDASTVCRVSPLLKRFTGKAAYVVSALLRLAAWSPPKIRVQADGRTLECESVIVTNIRKYAGEFVIAPDADIATPRLHAVCVSGGRFGLLRFAIAMLKGHASASPASETLNGPAIEVTGAMNIQLEGDCAGACAGDCPVRIESVSGQLNVAY
jgi:YegS/Rv2252/BmrU family lipid kinase